MLGPREHHNSSFVCSFYVSPIESVLLCLLSGEEANMAPWITLSENGAHEKLCKREGQLCIPSVLYMDLHFCFTACSLFWQFASHRPIVLREIHIHANIWNSDGIRGRNWDRLSLWIILGMPSGKYGLASNTRSLHWHSHCPVYQFQGNKNNKLWSGETIFPGN